MFSGHQTGASQALVTISNKIAVLVSFSIVFIAY